MFLTESSDINRQTNGFHSDLYIQVEREGKYSMFFFLFDRKYILLSNFCLEQYIAFFQLKYKIVTLYMFFSRSYSLW